MAENKAAENFCKNLFAAVGGRVFADTKALYLRKLSAWYIGQDQWSRALSQIVGELKANERGDVQLPALADIYTVLKGVQSADRQVIGTHFQLFDRYGGQCWARVLHDPSNPPPIPSDATNERLAIDPRFQQQAGPEVRASEVDAMVSHLADKMEIPF